MNIKVDIWVVMILAVVIFAVVKQCEPEPRTITRTQTVVEWKTDTVIKKEIQKVKEPVYVEKVKTLKGDTVVVFKDKETQSTIKANQYKTEIKSDSATARLDITTTGELLDVTGVIEYPKITTSVKTIEKRPQSGIYLYGQVPVTNFNSPEVGIMYQFRNTIGIMSGVQYNTITNKAQITAGLLIRIK